MQPAVFASRNFNGNTMIGNNIDGRCGHNSDSGAGKDGSATGGWHEMLRGGDRVLIRPIHKDDVEMERKFIEALSPESRRFRFLETMNSPSDESCLEKLTTINPLTDMAWASQWSRQNAGKERLKWA